VDAVYRDGSIQRTLPAPRPPAPPSSSAPDLSGLAGLLQVLFWVGVAVVGALLLAWIAREISARGRRVALAAAAASATAPDASILRAPLEAAEALAARGLWAEAIHALLLRTLETLVEATRTTLPPALTSREILRRVPLRDAARDALGDLVLAVEVSRFGDAHPGRDDYERCLDRFRDFAAAYGSAA
jgi:hypothetical protein